MKELEQLKQELEQTQLAYQMAAQMCDFKGGFLAKTSHELRSPLSSLIGLHQLILSDLCESPEEQKEFIDQAYKSSLKLMKLIDEIITVAKTAYGTKQLNLESFTVKELFEYIYQLTHLQAANRNLQLQILPPQESLYIYADHARLVQSIVNLIDGSVSVLKSGTIKVTADALNNSKLSKIVIELDCSPKVWQATIDSPNQKAKINLDNFKEFSQELSLSPSMRLLLSRTLLESMGGNLEIVDLSSQDANHSRTRIILVCQQPA